METLDQLTTELRGYCDREGLPQQCAQELLHEHYDNEKRRNYFQDFIDRWDRAEALEPPRRIGGFKEDGNNDDGYGDTFTKYHVCEVPFDWTDEQIDEWVRGHFYVYRCEHEYDCCGNYYPSSAEWARADVQARYRQYCREDEGEKQRPLTILVTQGWAQNV